MKIYVAKREHKIKITNSLLNDLMYVVGFALILCPTGIKNLHSSASSLISVMNAVFFAFILLSNIRKLQIKVQYYTISYTLMLAYFCAIHILVAAEIKTMLLYLAAFIYSFLLTQKSFRHGVSLLAGLCKFYLILNILSVIVFPNGIYKSSRSSMMERVQWVFGSKNNMSALLTLCFGIIIWHMYLNERNQGKQLLSRYIFYAAIALFPAVFCGSTGLGFLQGSSTGTVAVTVMVVLGAYILFLEEFRGLRFLTWILNPLTMFVIIVIAYVGTISMQMTALSAIVTSALGKNITFTSRTYIWQNAITYIKKSPIYGYGSITITYTNGATSVYNLILRTLLSYGIIGLALFILTILISLGNRHASMRTKSVFVLTMFGIFVVGMMSQASMLYVLIPATFLYLYREDVPEEDQFNSISK